MINSDDEIIDCENCGSVSNISLLEKFPTTNSEENVNMIAPQPSLKNQTLEVSVDKSYVICPGENCNEWIVINSDDQIIDCENCGTMSNIKLLKKFPLVNAENMNRQSVTVSSTDSSKISSYVF